MIIDVSTYMIVAYTEGLKILEKKINTDNSHV